MSNQERLSVAVNATAIALAITDPDGSAYAFTMSDQHKGVPTMNSDAELVARAHVIAATVIAHLDAYDEDSQVVFEETK